MRPTSEEIVVVFRRKCVLTNIYIYEVSGKQAQGLWGSRSLPPLKKKETTIYIYINIYIYIY